MKSLETVVQLLRCCVQTPSMNTTRSRGLGPLICAALVICPRHFRNAEDHFDPPDTCSQVRRKQSKNNFKLRLIIIDHGERASLLHQNMLKLISATLYSLREFQDNRQHIISESCLESQMSTIIPIPKS